MKKLITGLTVSIVLVASMMLPTGCYYDNEEYLYGSTSGCDTVGVSYSETIADLMNNQCNACHKAATNSGGVTLEGYSNVVSWVENGLLLKSIKHESGASPMPKGSAKMTDCDISKIEAWINAGYPNN